MLPERILVLVPHPDDEALLASGVISRAVREGKQLWTAIATNGAYLCGDYTKGSRRLTESLAAMSYLGLPKERVLFLGYPDTGMEPEASFLSGLLRETDLENLHTSCASRMTYGITGGKPDFHMEQTGCHGWYHRKGFEEDMDRLMKMVKPQLVITTSRYDIHGDHSALSHFTEQALTRYVLSGYEKPLLWEGLVHSPAGDYHWPVPDGEDSDFTLPDGMEHLPDFLSSWERRIRIPVLEDDRQAGRKRTAIQMYASALKDEEPEVVRYLLSFAKREELFFEIPYEVTASASCIP